MLDGLHRSSGSISSLESACAWTRISSRPVEIDQPDGRRIHHTCPAFGEIVAPQVVAAWIAAAAAIVAAAVNIYFTLFNERRRRDAEMMITALGYFEGKSQRRSAGIAALEVLRSRSKAWNEYRETVRQLFYRQLLYLFPHGVNRWETHEVANMEQMAVWLLDGKNASGDRRAYEEPNPAGRRAVRDGLGKSSR